MQKISSKLTIFFNEPFWIGVYERIANDKLEVCKITFGSSEPKDYEVQDYLLQNWKRLRFSPPVKAGTKPDIKTNPKRMQRAITKQLHSQGLGTKSQQALKLQQEEGKLARKKQNRTQKEVVKEQRYEMRQQKRKEKHRGR